MKEKRNLKKSNDYNLYRIFYLDIKKTNIFILVDIEIPPLRGLPHRGEGDGSTGRYPGQPHTRPGQVHGVSKVFVLLSFTSLYSVALY